MSETDETPDEPTSEPVVIAHHITIHEPGIYPDLEVDEYHADPVPEGSLSSSGARRLTTDPPAVFKYELDNPPESKPHFDIGHAAHRLVLGSGPEIVKSPYDAFRSNESKAWRAEAESRGAVVLKEPEWDMVHAMAKVIAAHPLASALFDADHGAPEQSLFWVDVETQVMLRSRLDWLPDTDGGRLIVPDYKTTTDLSDGALQKAIAEYGYHQQDDFYRSAVAAHGLAADLAFVFVFQSKKPPYLVRVIGVPATAAALAARQNRRAIDLYAACRAADHWPGYEDVDYLDLPVWYLSKHDH